MSVFINRNVCYAAKSDARSDTLLAFFHAQRTGGTTLRYVLGRVYGKNLVYAHQFMNGAKQWKDLSDRDIAGYKAFAGHSNFVKNRVRKRAILPITLLRHPVARALSLYYYCQQKENHALQGIALKNDPVDFIEEATNFKPHYMSNVQCRRLCGVADAQQAITVAHQHYLAVGFTEYLGDFVQVLGSILGWSDQNVESHKRDWERYGDEWSEKFSRAALSRNQEDLELYEYFATRYL